MSRFKHLIVMHFEKFCKMSINPSVYLSSTLYEGGTCGRFPSSLSLSVHLKQLMNPLEAFCERLQQFQRHKLFLAKARTD